MSPLEQIEKGLVDGDLTAIADGYKSLTGKNPLEFKDRLPKAKVKRGRKPKLKIVTPTPQEVDQFAEFRTPIPEKLKEGNDGRCITLPFVLPKTNEFKDNVKSHKEDIEIDKKLQRGVQRSSRRQAVNFVNLPCSRCGKGIEVTEDFHAGFADPTNSEDMRPQFVCEFCQK